MPTDADYIKELERIIEQVYQDLGLYPESGVSQSTYASILKIHTAIKEKADGKD